MTIHNLDVFLSRFGTVCCSMSSSNCCFLTCIQISQKTGQVVWYSHLFQNFPQFLVIHTVKDFGIVNKTGTAEPGGLPSMGLHRVRHDWRNLAAAAALDHQKSTRVPEKYLFLLYWLGQSLWLCGSQQTVENSQRDGNTRPPDLPPEKSVCRSGSNSYN